jgi:hypothetical protein
VRSWASGASIQREGSAVLVSLSTSQLLTFPCRAEVPRLQDEGGSTSSLVPLQRFNGSRHRRLNLECLDATPFFSL